MQYIQVQLYLSLMLLLIGEQLLFCFCKDFTTGSHSNHCHRCTFLISSIVSSKLFRPCLFSSYPAVQVGSQVQTWDQAGEEAQAAASCWTEGCREGRCPNEKATCPPCRWVYFCSRVHELVFGNRKEAASSRRLDAMEFYGSELTQLLFTSDFFFFLNILCTASLNHLLPN